MLSGAPVTPEAWALVKRGFLTAIVRFEEAAARQRCWPERQQWAGNVTHPRSKKPGWG